MASLGALAPVVSVIGAVGLRNDATRTFLDDGTVFSEVTDRAPHPALGFERVDFRIDERVGRVLGVDCGS